MKHVSLFAAITASLLSHVSFAQPSDDTRQGPPAGKRKPPQEAYTACEGQQENTAVIVTTPHGHELEATCQFMDNVLVAIPNNPPPRPPRQERE